MHISADYSTNLLTDLVSLLYIDGPACPSYCVKI